MISENNGDPRDYGTQIIKQPDNFHAQETRMLTPEDNLSQEQPSQRQTLVETPRGNPNVKSTFNPYHFKEPPLPGLEDSPTIGMAPMTPEAIRDWHDKQNEGKNPLSKLFKKIFNR